MAGHNSVMFGWGWNEASVLGSQIFGQALVESCEFILLEYYNIHNNKYCNYIQS